LLFKTNFWSQIIVTCKDIQNNVQDSQFKTPIQQNAHNFSLDIYITISYWTSLHVSARKGSSSGNQTKVKQHKTKLATFIHSWLDVKRVKELKTWTILRRAVLLVNCSLARTVSEAAYVLICVNFRDSACQAAVHWYNRSTETVHILTVWHLYITTTVY